MRLAHRGDWRRATENTIPAFLAALDIPACDGLELDVRLSADGVPVLSHDPDLARVFGRSERVEALTADELEEIGVPSLAAVLVAIGRRPFLDIELKLDTGRAGLEVIAAGRGPGLERAVVSSFHPYALEPIARMAPAWGRWLNSHTLQPGVIATAKALGCTGVAVLWRALDERSVALARDAGLEVAAWTVRRRPTFDRLVRMGVSVQCVEAAALDG
jgi:glycerophosphoryl diester phosphodiesterase